MATVRRRAAAAPKTRTPAKPAAAAARKPAAKAAPAATRRGTTKPPVAKAAATRDVTVYADKDATEYHKAFARWIVTEVGFDPNAVSSKRAAFLAGVSIATAARPAFMESDFLAEWREESGEAKRGPKAKTEPRPAARRTTKAAPVEEPEEDEFEDDDEGTDSALRAEELDGLTLAELRKIARDEDHGFEVAELKGKNKDAVRELILDVEYPEDESAESDAEDTEDEFEDEPGEDEFEDEAAEEPAKPVRRARGAALAAPTKGRVRTPKGDTDDEFLF